MFYKLSNTAELEDLESAFDAKFKYPLLHQKSEIINGMSEQSLPIITKNNSKIIDYGIWGLLPQSYQEDWIDFQNINNTLNISLSDLNDQKWIKDLPQTQRCIVLVSGYFTTLLHNGVAYPFYIHLKDHEPFALGGIYSVLNDGFMSFALVTSKLQSDLSEIHSIGEVFPVAFKKENYQQWFELDGQVSNEELNHIQPMNFNAHTISKEFYKNDIIFESILDPAHYKDLPILSLR